MTKRIGSTLSLALFAVLFALSLAIVAVRALGLGTYIVTGGSMEPSIHKGSLVLVQPSLPSDVRLGDVITFQQYEQTTTHRVIEIGRNAQGATFITKGDANVVADPEAKAFPGAVGIVRASVPVAGFAVAYVQAYWRLVLTLVAALIFFTCAGALLLRRDEPAPATLPARRLIRRPVLVTVDADEAWNAHLSWLARAQGRRTRVA